MRRFSVTTTLVFCAVFAELGAADASADDWPCKTIDHPTTISSDKRCVRVVETVHGDVVNDATVGDDDSERPGFFIGGDGLITGRLINNGVITGGGDEQGALTLGRDADVSGGIFNNGTIVSTRGNAVQLGYLHDGHWWQPRAAALTGDIVNAGLIDGHDNGIAALYGTMTGRLINESVGTITGGNAAVAIAETFTRWTGGIENHGLIAGHDAGILIGAPGGDMEFEGGLANGESGEITADDGPAVVIGGASFAGGLLNEGRIEGSSEALLIGAGEFLGGIVNAATGKILGEGGAAIRIESELFAGGLVNRGEIEGAEGGVAIEGDTFDGGLLNAVAAKILALNGDALFASAAWLGDFENHGTVSGASRGFAYAGPSFEGAVVNTGAIEGGDIAFFMNTPLLDGPFTNSGDIEGGATGVSLVVGAASGGFTNNGVIKGVSATGVAIDAGLWGTPDARADIVNAASGVITGGQTGFSLNALSIYGDFINDGEIVGGGSDTGLALNVANFFGDIVNNGALEASSNALHLVIGTLDGDVVNTGTITATAPNGVAVALAIGNGATFTNEEGGLIVGDVILGGPAAYTFVGRDGGVEGDVVGNGGLSASAAHDDRLIVEDGTQYFVDGALADLLRFDVNDGGVAVMGARFVGDPDGPGYGAANVDALAVNAGGRLYLDNDTILHVGSFTQAADGELTYLLVAPNGTPVAGQDYGRIDASGPVTLAGKLSVILDAASFGGTTETEFTYTDIIRGASFSGAFDETEIEGSSYFFTLALTYGDNALNLAVTRTPFDVTFCAQHLSQNSEDLGAALEAAFLAGGFTPEQIALFDFLGELEDVCSAYFDLGGAVLGDINSITVETAGPWKSAVNDRVNSTGATSCVVAGSAGCLTRFAQNEAGGGAVQSDADDPFAWLRTGVRPEGAFSVWGRLLGVQGDNRGRGGAAGSDFTVTGGIAGADYVFSPRFIAGAAVQWTTTDVDFKHRRDTADVQSFEVGGYFSYGDVDFCINGNTSIIFHDFDTYRFPFGGAAQGAYQGRTISAYAEMGKVFEFGVLRVEPVLALTYSGLDTDAYRETGTAGLNLLIVEGASHRSLKSMTGVRVAYPLDWLESGRKIVPEARILWAHEYMDNQAQFRAALATLPNNPFNVRGQEFARDSLLAGVGLNVPLSAQAVFYADYDASLSTDRSIQSVSVGARMSW